MTEYYKCPGCSKKGLHQPKPRSVISLIAAYNTSSVLVCKYCDFTLKDRGVSKFYEELDNRMKDHKNEEDKNG